jgi:hypothetical protein
LRHAFFSRVDFKKTMSFSFARPTGVSRSEARSGDDGGGVEESSSCFPATLRTELTNFALARGWVCGRTGEDGVAMYRDITSRWERMLSPKPITRERIAHMEWERGGLSLLVTERVLEDGCTRSLRQLHQSPAGVVVSDVAELEAALKCGKFV